MLPPSASPAIWTNEVGRRLARDDEVIAISRFGGTEERDGVRYLAVRRTPTGAS